MKQQIKQVWRWGSMGVLLLIIGLSIGQAQEEPAPEDFSQPPPVITAAVRPAPFLTLTDSGITADLLFPSLAQGSVGVIELRGDGIASGRVLFGKNDIPFVQSNGSGNWYALVVADIDTQPREYGLTIFVTKTDGANVILTTRVTVTSASFIRQQFNVPSDRAYLINPEVERNEYARIDAITADVTPENYWGDTAFNLPIDANITSAFGQYRILNQSVQTRHTGWDQRAPVGTPVGAIAGGVIAYASRLDIRGNYVVIDHGWGVYSGYAHFSQINVERGQRVEQGQIIGLSGNTGRSSGPHLHWEMVVNKEWIDSLAFMSLWLPQS